MPAEMAEFRFNGELNDFLPPGQRHCRIAQRFQAGDTVKHIMEALGVPHPEVGRILVGGEPVEFDYRLRDGDRVTVHPAGGPVAEGRFVLDLHLGTLARRLRLLGFDTAYRNDFSDEELVAVAVAEDRIILTRDRGVLKRRVVANGYCIRDDDPDQQVLEVLRRFDLLGSVCPFSRCMRCNAALVPVPKAEIDHLLLPNTRRDHHDFRRCAGCGQVYWRGSHYDRLVDWLDDLRRRLAG